MCNRGTPWPELLPTVLLGLRTFFKEDIQSSASKMVYGTPIRLPNEFFIDLDDTVDPTSFLSIFREHMQEVRPTSTAHHIKQKMFVLKGIDKCTHVFLRRSPLHWSSLDCQTRNRSCFHYQTQWPCDCSISRLPQTSIFSKGRTPVGFRRSYP